MENNLINEEARTNELLLIDTTSEVSKEISEEFSLPDYVPEVRRVLCVRAQPLPEGKFVNSAQGRAELETNGTVTYSLIYQNDSGNLCALPLSSTYETVIPLNDTPYLTRNNVYAENVNVRVSAPRKINIRSTIKNRVLAFKKSECNAQIMPNSSAEQIYLQKREKNISTLSLVEIAKENIKISERLDNLSDGEKPIWCDASVLLNEVKCQKDMVLARGEVSIKCLLVSDGKENVIERTFPVSEEIKVDGIENGNMARLYGRCVSLSISNEQSEKNNELFFDLTYELHGEVVKNKETAVEIDAYSLNHESESSYKELEYQSSISSGVTSFTVNETIKRKNKDINEIIATLIDPVYEKCEIKGNKVNLLGTMYITVIGKSMDEDGTTLEYLSEEYKLPIKLEVEGAKDTNKITSLCNLALGNSSVRYDEESLRITAEVFASYSLYGTYSERVLDTLNIKTDKEIKRNNSEVRVCFVKKGEELWDIAKRYHTTTTKLKEQNDLIDDELFNKKCLII